jgi:Domain of unknown function (DUF3883)
MLEAIFGDDLPAKPKSDRGVEEFLHGLRKIVDDPDEAAVDGSVRGKWGGGGNIERKAQVEQASIEAVKEHYKNFTVATVEKDNVGWDLEVTPADGGEVICLEIKGLFGSELKVGMTPNEYRAFAKHRDGKNPHYRLCVVTNALSDQPLLRVFRYESSAGAWCDEVLDELCALVVEPRQSALISLTVTG